MKNPVIISAAADNFSGGPGIFITFATVCTVRAAEVTEKSPL